MRRRRPVSEELRDFARLQVRAGLLEYDEQHAVLLQAIRDDLPDADADDLAATWLDECADELGQEQASWPAVTDHDRLAEAFAALDALGVAVLQGVDDHWAARGVLDERSGLRGVAWFTPSDVWHAIDEGMLEINLWHASGANAAEGDQLLDEVLAVLSRHDLGAHFDEGRIEVAAHWQRRL